MVMKFVVVLLLAATCFANQTPPNRRTTTTRASRTTTTNPRTTTTRPRTTTTRQRTTTTHHTTAPLAQCGIPAIKPDTNANIIGGEDAVPYSWPWQVALFQKPSTTSVFCSGTLISNQWVMTAGHCFNGHENQTSKWTVKLGVFKKIDDDEPEEVELGLSEIHVHPKFVEHAGIPSYDITLLKLDKPVEFDEDVSPVCFPTVQDEALPPAGTGVFVTGWGDTSEGGQESPTLKQVTVPLVDDDTCKKTYHSSFVASTMFCAGLKQGGKDTCQGDSGGPVVYQDPATGAWKQVGITSWGHGCAEPNEYGVYSKVSAYVDFINQYVTDL